MVICSTIIHTLNYTGDQGTKITHTNNPAKYSGTICELSDKKEIYWEFDCDFILSSPLALKASYLYSFQANTTLCYTVHTR